MSGLSGPTVEVLYSCYGCATRSRPVRMRERIDSERLTDWIRLAQGVIAADHAVSSPSCQCEAFDLMVHAPPGGRGLIGKAVRQ